MVGFAYTFVAMETLEADAALNRVDSQRRVIQSGINAFITAWEGRRGFTIRTAERMREQLNAMFGEIDKRAIQTEQRVKKVERESKASLRFIISHAYHSISQVWNMIEDAAGLTKDTSTQMLGWGITAISGMISAAYAAAATYTAMGPWGIPFIGVATTAAVYNTVQQGNLIQQQHSINSAPAVVGNVNTGESW